MANINKNQIGYNEALSAGTANSLMVQYRRANAAPLDISEVFTSISAASDYAKSGPTAYAGQVIAVAGEDIKTEVYTITSASTIVRLVDEYDLLEVETSAGKIDVIKVNGSPLEIDGKSVNIDLSSYVTNNQLSALVSTDTGKTIREIANDEIASKLISSDAKESLDTLEEIAAWIQAHPEDAASMNESIASLEKSAHTHDNKAILDGITSDKVTAWDAAEKNAKDYVDGKVDGKFDASGSAAAAETAAKAYVDGLLDELDIVNTYELKGAANDALEAAKSYADGKATSSLSSAKSYVDGKVDGKFDAAGAAATAEQNAKNYADGLASNYDKVGSAASAETAAKAYADSLAGNYDASGSAASAEAAAKAYADSLAGNYDASGSAAQALTDAKAYTDDEISKLSYDASGSAAQALTDAKAYVDSKVDGKFDSIGSAESALSSAKSYVDGKVDGKFDASGSAAQALTDAKTYIDGKVDGKFDASGSAAQALADAKTYTNDEISKLSYDASGSAAQALTDAKAYVDSKVDGKFDASGSAAAAETAAKAYADSLAGNYDASGSAASALEAAKSYTDGLAGNYDSKGSAAGALSSAKAYADGLASNYDKVGSAASAETAAKAYVDTKLVDYATQSFVTDKIVSALTNGTVDITGYAKIEVVNELDANVYASAKTYTDESISLVEEELNWIYANDENVKEKIRHWRGTREKYEFLKRNGALNAWTKYVVIDTNNGKDTIVEYYGENQIYELTGQLLPVKDVIEGISSVTAAPYDRYLVGRNSIGYNIYECVLDDENNLKWYIKPFDYRYGVRVISRGLKNYVYFDGELITYDEIDGGVF